MGDIRWTNEQHDAIYTHDCNLLVAAAAGSGKTAVLVERIIKFIMDDDKGIDIDKLLVVTFTNAAASEMRERIGEALAREINKSSSPRLQRQLELLNRASITTIHSFCLGVIKNNFHKTDLDPGFRVGDETEMLFLKQEAIEEIFEVNYKMDQGRDASSSLFLKLVETYCDNKSDNNLMELVLEIYKYSMSMPQPKNWLEESINSIRVNENSLDECGWMDILKSEIKKELKDLSEHSLKALELINENEEFQKFYNVFIMEQGYIQELTEAINSEWEEFVDVLRKVSFERMPTIRKCENPEIKVQISAIRDEVKKTIGGYVEDYKNFKKQSVIEDIGYMEGIIEALIKLVLEFGERYKSKKRDRGIIDFNDFEHYCLEILIEKNEDGIPIYDEKGHYIASEVAVELRRKYDEILIDEYQDSNMVQEVILTTISKISEGMPNVFMVGDVKQSVYRFRQAKPEIFLKKYSTYSDKKGDMYRRIMLFKNFRSRKEILDGVNYIFEEVMSEEVGELNYNENEALNLGADYKSNEGVEFNVGGAIELNLIEKKGQENDDELEEELEDKPTDIQIEARFVAKRIRELIDNREGSFKIFDKNLKDYRSVQYKDVVILLRSTSKWAPIFLEELKIYDIPIYADTSTGYFETSEIKTIMSVLKIIDNPRQDIPLIGVLKSPIGGFTAEELAIIRTEDKSGSYYDALLKHNNSKVEEFLEKLNKWREISVDTPIDELIWKVYTETGYYGFVGALNNGLQRQANLKVLFQRAKKYGETSYKGLFNFINFINKLNKSSGDLGSAKILGENENVVRIMSIHKSKGLEFPVVILAGTGKQFNFMDLRKKILLHQELGFGPDYINSDKRISYPTLIKKAISKKIKLETISEEMRILYVALTRPKEKLIITGSLKDISKTCEGYADLVEGSISKVPELRTAKAKTYLDWIVPALMRHVSGEVLRKQCRRNFNSGIKAHPSLWEVNIFNKEDILPNNIEKVEQANINIAESLKEKLRCVNENDIESYDDFNKKIEENLNFKYKYREASMLPRVLTVTEVKRLAMEQLENEFSQYDEKKEFDPKNNTIPKKPKFLSKDTGLSAGEKGTAMHEVMQYVDLNRVESVEEIKKQVEELYMREFISKKQAEVIDSKKIYNFFKSYIGQKILLNKEGVYREKSFNMAVSSTSINKKLDKNLYMNEYIIIQGIIDCYIDEGDCITVIDYKTDKVSNGDVETIANRYRVQLDYYTKAIEIIMNKPVKHKHLYLFDIEKEVEL